MTKKKRKTNIINISNNRLFFYCRSHSLLFLHHLFSLLALILSLDQQHQFTGTLCLCDKIFLQFLYSKNHECSACFMTTFLPEVRHGIFVLEHSFCVPAIFCCGILFLYLPTFCYWDCVWKHFALVTKHA